MEREDSKSTTIGGKGIQIIKGEVSKKACDKEFSEHNILDTFSNYGRAMMSG